MNKYRKYVDKYDYSIHYSEEDRGYITNCTELPSISGFGKKQEESLKECKAAVRASLSINTSLVNYRSCCASFYGLYMDTKGLYFVMVR